MSDMRRFDIARWALLVMLTAAAAARAQTTFTQCGVEGGACTISAPKLVRYGQPFTPAWTATRRIEAGTFPCTNAFWGDPSPGTGKRCEVMDAPPPVATIPWVLTWQHATAREDGSPLTDRSGYLIESATDSTTWVEVARAPATAARALVELPAGTRQFRLRTLSLSGESLASTPIEATRPRGTVPLPPTDAGVAGAELSLVSGASTGLRAVYAPTSTRSRGAKIGDLSVGPTTQTVPPFNRVRCDLTDSFRYGNALYARVIDPRVQSQYRAGYVTGCVSYGVQ